MITFTPGEIIDAEAMNNNFKETQTSLTTLTKKLAGGTTTATVGNDGYFWVKITFETAFAKAPAVSFMPVALGDFGLYNGGFWALNGATKTTDFNAYGYLPNMKGKTVTFSWTAIAV